MRKVSLNLDQETPLPLRQGLVRNSEFSRSSFSPLRNPQRLVPRPKDALYSREFSGFSPIKHSQRDSDSSFNRSLFPNPNKGLSLAANENLSRFDSALSSEVSRIEKKPLRPSNSLKTGSDNLFFSKDKENREPNPRFPRFPVPAAQNPISSRSMADQRDVFPVSRNPENRTRPLRKDTQKMILDHNNICDLVEDFESSYNLQIQTLKREYNNQYLLIAVFLVFWAYLMRTLALWIGSLMGTEAFNEEENDSLWFFSGFCKCSGLMALIIYSRVSSFETVSRNLGWKEEIIEIINILDGFSAKASSCAFSLIAGLYFAKETYYLYFSSVLSLESNFLCFCAFASSVFFTFHYYLNQHYFIEPKLDLYKYRDSYVSLIYHGIVKSFNRRTFLYNLAVLIALNAVIFLLHECQIAFTIANLFLTEKYQAFSFISTYTLLPLGIVFAKTSLFLLFIFLSIEIPTNVSKKLRLKTVTGFESCRNFNPLYVFSVIFHIGKKTSLTNCFSESLKFLLINLPFPNKSFLNKQILYRQQKLDFTIWDALVTISNDRLFLFYGVLSESKPRIEGLMGSERISRVERSFPEKLRSYFLLRRALHEIYCNIHTVTLITTCIFEGILISKHNQNFSFNLEKGSFKRFIEITRKLKGKLDEYEGIIARSEQLKFRKFTKKIRKLQSVLKRNLEVSEDSLTEGLDFSETTDFELHNIGANSFF